VTLLVLGVAVLNKEIIEEKLCDNSNREAVKTGYILAQLGHAPGAMRRVALVSPKAVDEKSRESIASALFVIKEISEKVADTMEETPVEHRPFQVRLDFSLLLTNDGKAVITKSDKEQNLKVTLIWKEEREENF